MSLTGNVTKCKELKCDSISELNSGSGVTIDSVLLKDNNVSAQNVTASGDLTVTGTSTLGEINSGATTVSSGQIDGNLNATGDLTVTGDSTFNTITSTGTTTFNSMEVVTNCSVGGTCTVTGNTSLTTVQSSGLATLESASIGASTTVGGVLTADTINTNTISERTAGSGVTINDALMKDSDFSGTEITASGNLDVSGNATFTGNTTFSGDLTVYSNKQEREYLELEHRSKSGAQTSFYKFRFDALIEQSGSITYSNAGTGTVIQVGVAGYYNISFKVYVTGGTLKFNYIRTSSTSAFNANVREHIQESRNEDNLNTITVYLPANYYIEVYPNYGGNITFGTESYVGDDSGDQEKYLRLTVCRVSW